MVLRMLALPLELQADVVRLLDDVTTAGRLAQASHSCKQLLQQRLATFIEAKRNELEAKRNELRAAAASRYTAGSRRAAIHAHFERTTDAVPFHYRCWCTASGHTGAIPRPCALVLVDRHSRVPSHLRHMHPEVHAAL